MTDEQTATTVEAAPEEWALVELMGHRRMAGRVTEEIRFGVPMCRVDVFVGDALEAVMSQCYGGSSIYCFTPITEQVARRFSVRNTPEPISSWDLPALEPARDDDEIEAEIEEDDFDSNGGLRMFETR